MTHPAAAPIRPWWPATCPAAPPMIAPLMQPFALAGSVAIAIASASAVQPRIAFMRKLRSMSFQSMCRALVPGRPGFMDPRLPQQVRQLGDVGGDAPGLVAGDGRWR